MSLVINNPFNMITDIQIISDESDELIKIDEYNISKYFRFVYILCPFTNDLDTNIFKDQIERDYLEKILDRMILYKSNINLVKNQVHYNNLIQLSSSILQKSNKYDYELEENILVLPIFNISFLNLQKYLDKFNKTNNLKDLYDHLVISEYFMEDSVKNYRRNMVIKDIINNLDEAKYWEYIYNCNLNFTKLFNQRNFNLQKYTNLDSKIKILFKELGEVNVNDNYIEEIFKYKKYVDPAAILNKQKYRLFRVENNFDFVTEDLEKIFEKISKRNRFFLFCRILVSKKYCHLVFSVNIFNMLEGEIRYYAELFQYLFGYTWLTFYMEECIKKSCLKTTDRNILSIDMASKLPVFPVTNEVHKNPYLPMMVSSYHLNSNKNVNGIKITKNNYHRIATLEEFKERLNIFITNYKNFNIFDCLDFKKNKMAITGSIMTACVQYLHPLTTLFKNKQNDSIDSILCRYFQEYYCEADIDIMIKTTDNFEFLDIVNNIYNNIHKNLRLYFDTKNPPLNKKYIKNTYVYITKEFIEKYFSENVSIDFIVTNLQSEKIKELLLPEIIKLHNKQIDKSLEEFSDSEIDLLKSKYPQYFNLDYNNISIRLSRNYQDKILVDSKIKNMNQINIDLLLQNIKLNEERDYNEEDIKLLNSFKVHLSSPLLDHNFEIFPIRGDDFLSSVNLFHLPCVRAFYDGENVYMTPSCISSHLTYMNMNYKYVAGTKDPLEIINKYRMRGFGTFLNENELKLYIKYIYSNNFWNNLFNLTKNNLKSCLGYLPLAHKLFHPRLYNAEYFEKKNVRYLPLDNTDILYATIDDKNWYNTQNYLAERYNSRDLSVYMNKISCQNEKTGNINPIKLYIINYIYEEKYLNTKENNEFPLPPDNLSDDNVKKKLVFDDDTTNTPTIDSWDDPNDTINTEELLDV
jgi:hypothetical protein